MQGVKTLFGKVIGQRTSRVEDEQRLHAERIARAALKLYGLRDAEVELLTHGFVQVFRVRSVSRGAFALRLYNLPEAIRKPDLEPLPADPRRRVRAHLRSPGVLRWQMHWRSALRRDTGLLVPEPVLTLDGELVGEVTVKLTTWRKPGLAPERRRSALLRWVPGVHKGADLTEADLLRVGSFVARMHDHARGYAAPEGSEFPRWDWHWPFGETVLLWSEGRKFYSEEEMETYRQAAQRVYKRLEELGEGRDVFGLIHFDVALRNVVFSGERVGVIDFDGCGLGYYLLDLATFCRSLQNTLPAERSGSLWEAFLRGYASVRPLPEHIHAHLDRYLLTFNVMKRVAAVSRRLELLSSDPGGAEHEARERWLRFLSTSHEWLRKRVQHLSVLPGALDGLPFYGLCNLPGTGV